MATAARFELPRLNRKDYIYSTEKARTTAAKARAWLNVKVQDSERKALYETFTGNYEKRLTNILSKRYAFNETTSAAPYDVSGLGLKVKGVKGAAASQIGATVKKSVSEIYAPISAKNLYSSFQDLYYMGEKTASARGPIAGFWRYMGGKVTQRTPWKVFGKRMELFDKFQGTVFGKVLPQTPIGKFRAGAMVVGAIVGGMEVARTLGRAAVWTGQNKYRDVGTSSGPGYVTWSKRRGMPANHLSTDNLVNSLHNMRHSSII